MGGFACQQCDSQHHACPVSQFEQLVASKRVFLVPAGIAADPGGCDVI